MSYDTLAVLFLECAYLIHESCICPPTNQNSNTDCALPSCFPSLTLNYTMISTVNVFPKKPSRDEPSKPFSTDGKYNKYVICTVLPCRHV